jgi:hypothetical protein
VRSYAFYVTKQRCCCLLTEIFLRPHLPASADGAAALPVAELHCSQGHGRFVSAQLQAIASTYILLQRVLLQRYTWLASEQLRIVT